MKSMGDMLLTRHPFSEITMGNTALVRAMIEAGTRVVTSYPGSPTPEVATAIHAIPKEDRPFYFEFSTNEKVATEIAYGAAVNGHLSTVFFKSVGLNVAADTFVQLSLMNIIGGMIVVLGDDPGANSSQNEQDNRHYAQMTYMPVLEPAEPSEVYSFYLAAAKLSQKKQMPVILRLTTHVCHGKEKVNFGAYDPQIFDKTPRFDVKNGPYIPITSLVFPMKRRALKNLAEVAIIAETSSLNTLVNNHNSERGVITFGLPYLSLQDAISETTEKPDILKLGFVYPLPKEKILTFLTTHKEVKILEELDNIMEKDIKVMAYEAGLTVKIIGKIDDDDWVGEYTPDKVASVLRKCWPNLLPEEQTFKDVPNVPARPAQLCPGCGHRSAFYAIKKAVGKNDIKVADIGCHTLGFLAPYEMGEMLMCMGASTSIASGLSLFNDSRKVIAFLGDSTFFHAGLPGIANAVFNNHNVTLILMENGTTAMTGHQNHPATGRNFDDVTTKIPVRKVLEGLGIKHIAQIDTYQQQKLTDLVKEALAFDGFSVVIASHPCMLKFDRQQRRKPDYQPRKVEIDQDVCTKIHECIEEFGCPSFSMQEDGRVEVNHDLCIGDGSCLQTCASKAIKPVKVKLNHNEESK